MQTVAFGGVLVALGILLVIGLVVGAVIFVIMRSWIKVARPDEALVLSGKKKDKDKDSALEVIINGRAIVNPINRRHEVISLRSRKVELNVSGQSLDGVTLHVRASALVKISSNEEMVRRAAERFGSQDAAIQEFTCDQLEGSLRGVIALLKVSELMKERKQFSEQISDSVSQELSNQGLHLDSFQIMDISDENGYIKSLGKPEIEAKRQAAEISSTNAERAINKEKLSNNEANLIEQTAYDTNQANSQAEIGKATANSEQAEALARAQAEQAVLAQRAENKQAQLDADIKKVADANRYQLETESDAAAYAKRANADADRSASQSKAESASFVRKQEADAEAYALEASANARRVSAEAEAEAVRVQAEAEAGAIRARGEAKAAALKAEAEALKENQGAILAKEIVGQLPTLMAEYAKGYAQMGKVTFIGGADGASSALGGQSAAALKGVFETVKESTGIDLAEIVQGRAMGSAIGQAMSQTESKATKIK